MRRNEKTTGSRERGATVTVGRGGNARTAIITALRGALARIAYAGIERWVPLTALREAA